MVVSQYFYPETFRINDMCQEWVKRGYKVTVVTGIPNYGLSTMLFLVNVLASGSRGALVVLVFGIVLSSSTMVDKVAVKDYVKSIIGEDYIIPTLGVYDKFNEIDFEKLPNSFVIKCAHDSGGIVICPNKENFDYTAAKKKIEKYQKRDFYLGWREWPYKNVPRRIIVEQYMEDKKTKELRDYKFFTFNGKVKALFIASDRQNPNEDTKFDFFDESYNHLPIINGHPNANTLPERPKNFELMKELAEKLAVGIPHVRVDFYEIDGKVYFGEMTFFHWSGVVPFEPKEWDLIFGDWIQLPNEKIIE